MRKIIAFIVATPFVILACFGIVDVCPEWAVDTLDN